MQSFNQAMTDRRFFSASSFPYLCTSHGRLGDDGIHVGYRRHADKGAERDADVMRVEGLAQGPLDVLGVRLVELLDDHEEFVAAHAEDVALAGLLLGLQHDIGHRLDEASPASWPCSSFMRLRPLTSPKKKAQEMPFGRSMK